MEKRRVRIYKAGGQQGSYVNKTASYFEKGGIQTQQQQLDDNQLISIMMKRLSMDDESANMQSAENDLAQLNIEPGRIKKLSRYVLNYIDDQRSLQDAEQTGNEETAAKLQAEEDANMQTAQEEELLAQQQQQRQQQQLQDIYNDDTASADNGDYDQVESDIIMRDGGVSNKRAFISNFIKLAKKAEGGNTEEEKPDIKTDIPNGRVQKFKDFQNALKNNASNAVLKEQAEEAYKQEQEQLQQIPPQNYEQDNIQGYAQGGSSMFSYQDEDPENPMHHIAAYATGIHDIFDNPQVGTSSGPEQLQFGGWGHGRERRAARRMNRMMPQVFNQIGNMMSNPFMQQQMSSLAQFMPNPANLGLANIDVRRTGMFGIPKEYTINFNSYTPIKPQDVENTRKQIIVNADEILKDVETETKTENTNTSTETNAEVAKEVVKNPDINTINVVTKKVKKNSGNSIPGGNKTSVVTTPIGTTPVDTTPVVIPPVNTLGSAYGTANTPADMYFYNSDKPGYNYTFNDGKLMYKTGEGDFTNTITDPTRIKELQSQLKGADIYTLPDKPGFYYRHRADGSYVKFKGDPKNYASTNKSIGLITPKDPNYAYLNKNKKYSYSVSKPIKQEGGFVDPESGLYRFMSGGEDDLPTQEELAFKDSKNVSSPYFKEGGYFQKGGHWDSTGHWIEGIDPRDAGEEGVHTHDNETSKEYVKNASYKPGQPGYRDPYSGWDGTGSMPWFTASNAPQAWKDAHPEYYSQNINYAQEYLQRLGMNINPLMGAITPGANWNKAVGRPFGTINPISGMIGPNAQVSSIDVRKTRKFGPNKGAPKKFTVNYNVPGQPGINASGTPKSYVGSDGQTHWMTNDNVTKQSPNQSWRDNRNDKRTERTSKWFGEHGKDTWANNNQSGEDDIFDETGTPTNDYEPGVTDYLNKQINSNPSIFDENGMPTNDYAPGVTDYLRRAPIPQYRIDQADENQADRQAWDLERLRLQNRAYGGESLPKAQFGPPEDIPFGYFKDPNGTGVYRNLAGEIYRPKTNLEGNTDKLMGNEFTQEGNGLTTDKSMGFDSSGDAYRNEGLLSDEEKQAGASQQVSQKFKNKQEWNIDAKGALDFGNMAGNALLGFAERSQQALQNRNIGSKYDASNLFAQTSKKNKGTYGQEGDFRPNETGFKGVVQYGGYMEEGGSYEEGGDTWMSEDQIQQFLAEGGELEFV